MFYLTYLYLYTKTYIPKRPNVFGKCAQFLPKVRPNLRFGFCRTCLGFGRSLSYILVWKISTRLHLVIPWPVCCVWWMCGSGGSRTQYIWIFYTFSTQHKHFTTITNKEIYHALTQFFRSLIIVNLGKYLYLLPGSSENKTFLLCPMTACQHDKQLLLSLHMKTKLVY